LLEKSESFEIGGGRAFLKSETNFHGNGETSDFTHTKTIETVEGGTDLGDGEEAECAIVSEFHTKVE
jgi:hypothetical protein